MTKSELDACWRDSRNWRWGVYYCKSDPRVIVPKRAKWMGWTVNLARPGAIAAVLLLLVISVGPVLFVAQRGAGTATVVLVVAGSIAVVCLLCAYLASRTE